MGWGSVAEVGGEAGVFFAEFGDAAFGFGDFVAQVGLFQFVWLKVFSDELCA